MEVSYKIGRVEKIPSLKLPTEIVSSLILGIYMHSYDAGLNVKSGFPVFSTCLEANYIKKREDVYSLYSLTDEDKVSILELARDPRIGENHTP